MKTCKQIGIFLLLGVMLVGLLISGCTPVEQTQTSTSEPEDPNAIAFRDLPGVNMDDIDKISIYIGDDSEPVQTIGTAEELSNFRATFEELRFTSHDLVSSAILDSAAIEASRYLVAKTTYRIQVKSDDGTTWDIYVAENDRVYYSPRFDICYISTSETEYIDALGIGPVLNRSYIEGCTYASITRSMLDSQIHMLLGEENVIAFFDMFFSGLELTDDNERIAEVRKSGYVGTLSQPFQICFTCAENNFLLISVYENGAIIIDYKDHELASVQDNVVDKQEMEKWLKEHDAL